MRNPRCDRTVGMVDCLVAHLLSDLVKEFHQREPAPKKVIERTHVERQNEARQLPVRQYVASRGPYNV